jgi:chromosome segregation ATPase
MMKFMKLLQPNHSDMQQSTAASVYNPEKDAEDTSVIEVRGHLETVDSVETKVSQTIQELFESRRTYQTQVEEHHRIILDKDTMIQELMRERTFLESKTNNLSEEIDKLQEDISNRKVQYDQLLSEFNAYKAQQGDKLQKLQDRLHERELNNQQLLLDFNQYRQKSEGRVQFLETQARDHQVKHHHLEKKYQEALQEISRLDKVIKDFVAQASTIADATRAR